MSGAARLLHFALDPTDNDRIAVWTAARIPHVAAFAAPFRCAAVLARDGPLAGFVFHDWQAQAGTLQFSMAAASPRWASRGTLSGLFRYAFATNGANKLWTATPHLAQRALRFNRGIGMRQEAVLRHQFGPDSHAVICSMLAREWRASRWNQEI